MWAGTYGRGAFKIKKSDFSYTQISSETMPDMKLQHIYAILCDKEGNVWLGGIREKLHKISVDGSVKIYPISQIRSIIESEKGGILVGSKQGVHRIENDKVESLEAVMSNKMTSFTPP